MSVDQCGAWMRSDTEVMYPKVYGGDRGLRHLVGVCHAPAVQASMQPGTRREGKVAIVTGSTRGIGRATALRFAREGARVIVTGRTEDAGRAVEDEIRAAGGSGVFIPTDLAREEDVVQM